jgi:signal transduction histidine kinase
MERKITDTGSLRPQELEAVYAISSIVAESMDIDEALGEIINIARLVFIFDSVVLYLEKTAKEGPSELEAAFARAIGRGRTLEADLAWGEIAAREAYNSGKKFIKEAEIRPNTDRLDQVFYLGLPMIVGGNIIGALVFLRFGGPAYTTDQITLAEFIATHVTQLLEHQRLVERIGSLEAERRLAQLQEDFIAAVSHELNTPLGFIKGYTTTLLREDTIWDAETQRDFLTIIDEEADRLSELIDNLLDSSRLQSGVLPLDMKSIPLDSLFSDFEERIASRYKNLDIELDLQDEDLQIRVDPKRLWQVFDNLINNAAKYASGSTLTISALRHKQYARIQVKDNGPGIASEHLEKLFNRFYRVPERSAGVRGSGLGLFICERLIRAQGGLISVESVPGMGTSFLIDLPLDKTPIPTI